MSNLKRKNGFYWVKANSERVVKMFYPGDGWLIAEWVCNSEGGFWELTGVSTTFTDKYFDVIDETPLTHE